MDGVRLTVIDCSLRYCRFLGNCRIFGNIGEGALGRNVRDGYYRCNKFFEVADRRLTSRSADRGYVAHG